MSQSVSYAGSAAMAASLYGLKQASRAMEVAAQVTASAGVEAIEASHGVDGDTVILSEAVTSAGSIEDGLLDANVARHAYSANLATLRADEQDWQHLLDAVLPLRS